MKNGLFLRKLLENVFQSSEKQAWKKNRAQNMGEVEEILRMKGYSRNTAVFHAWMPTCHNKTSQKALRNMAVF